MPYIDLTNLANYWNHFFPRVIQPLFFTYLFVFKIFPFVDKAVHESIEETKLKKDRFVLDKNREMELYKDEEARKIQQQIESIKNRAKESTLLIKKLTIKNQKNQLKIHPPQQFTINIFR